MSDYAVYILHGRGTDYYKIGLAKNLHTRIIGVQTNCPFKIDLVRKWHYSSKKEARVNEIKLQRQLRTKRCRGEWYKMDEDEVPKQISSQISEEIEEERTIPDYVRKPKKKKRQCKHFTVVAQSKLGLFNWAGN